jgi:hypothetical protein
LYEELCRRVGRIHHHKRYLPDERPEITLIYGDAVPTFQEKKVAFRLIRTAKNPRRG